MSRYEHGCGVGDMGERGLNFRVGVVTASCAGRRLLNGLYGLVAGREEVRGERKGERERVQILLLMMSMSLYFVD